jgi:hypothetical protein
MNRKDFMQLVELATVTAKSMKPHAFSNIKSLIAMMDENENIERTFEEMLPTFNNRGFRIG